jgi:hypothetical protein
MRARPGVIHVLTSPLLADDEIGELAGLTITLRANQNGGTHVVGCRNLSSKAGDAESVTVAAYRAADPARHPCRVCGGGFIAPLSAEQDEQVAALGVVWNSRLERERENAAAQRQWEELTRRADVVDERARYIVDGWNWNLEKERDTGPALTRADISTVHRRAVLTYVWGVGRGRAAAIRRLLAWLDGDLGPAIGQASDQRDALLRPFLILRILGVIPVSHLTRQDSLLILAKLAEASRPDISLSDFARTTISDQAEGTA